MRMLWMKGGHDRAGRRRTGRLSGDKERGEGGEASNGTGRQRATAGLQEEGEAEHWAVHRIDLTPVKWREKRSP